MQVRAVMGVLIVSAIAGVSQGAVADFEDLGLAKQMCWNGADESGGFRSGGAFFSNNYDAQWGSWDGFSYSNLTDTTAGGLDGQYTAIPGFGQGGSATYAIGYVGWTDLPTVTLDAPALVEGLYVTNSNYGYYSMLNGDAFAKQFGGASGADPDWFKLTIIGKDDADAAIGEVEFYLADFRFSDAAEDYIVDMWTFVDLRPLGEVRSLQFALDSSDVGPFGMNTPASFAIDTVVPEPGTFVLLGLGCLLARRRNC